ncbi:hypothetical protein EJF36_02750 [Bacillus sp. HMF5848]|uniref:hypothetical protein n=1 Tax=Bacillus sp. HMF5848 TaxID=2495421 RepID=UPI000F78B2F2|nr:hypothetical protein [Bacillus sp. HMF5848]RSK25896.1 hypothetical protein EJF36_02750 [Bacillus sp. HMF5848]
MDYKRLRSFAAGLIVATAVSAVAYFMQPDELISSEALAEANTEEINTALTEEEMREMLTAAGYVIHTEEEWNTLQDRDEEQSQTESQEKTQAQEGQGRDQDGQAQNEAQDPVQSTEEQNQEQVAVEPDKDKQESEVPVEKAPTATTTTVTVAEGMTSFEVGQALVQLGIIDKAYNFTMEVERRGIANKLQLGTYNISSDMTVDQVIAMVFR